ncbi:MAG TPA: peptidylprolyl isomerase [Polyangium sp.]|nr:peptidylprolyl isomerase [Polyangium sp.]
MSPIAIGPDTHVTLTYVLFDEDGDAADRATAADPLQYIHGYAQIIPGLERGLTGMHAGDRRDITVPPDDAFGHHDDDGVFEVDKADFEGSEDVALGDEFVAQGPDGNTMAMRVIEVLEDAFVVDTNHPLAGQTVRFQVEVSAVRTATEDEITSAQLDLERRAAAAHEHEHDENGCCDHDHGHDHAQPLVQLSRKH